jgi:CBS domain containing-hemolysin-like protein
MAWFILGLLVYFLVLLSERTLAGISPHHLDQLHSTPSRLARLSQSIIAETPRVLSALLLARLLLQILTVTFTTVHLTRLNDVHAALFDISIWSGLPGQLTWCIAGLVYATLLVSVFWLLKKTNWPRPGGAYMLRGLQWLSPFILFWKFLFTPFLPGRKIKKEPDKAAAPSVTSTASVFSGGKHRDIELLKSIVKFSDVTVKQVMQPRSRIVAVDFRTRFGDLLPMVREAGFSRLPVYDEDLDNVTGVLYVKDLVSHLDKPADFEWQSLIRTNILLVPEAKRVSELLQEFKRNRRHLAIVVDEYGGSAGIVTMEDILEEITGEIRDEFDEESEIHYRKLDDYNYLFEGQTQINDVCRIAGLAPGTFDEARGAADTLAGLALELKGDIPKPGAELAWNGYLLTIVAADNRRIGQLKLTII